MLPESRTPKQYRRKFEFTLVDGQTVFSGDNHGILYTGHFLFKLYCCEVKCGELRAGEVLINNCGASWYQQASLEAVESIPLCLLLPEGMC